MGNGGMLFVQFVQFNKSYGFKDVPSNVAALIEDGKAFPQAKGILIWLFIVMQDQMQLNMQEKKDTQ